MRNHLKEMNGEMLYVGITQPVNDTYQVMVSWLRLFVVVEFGPHLI
jgi:hypothetical protein